MWPSFAAGRHGPRADKGNREKAKQERQGGGRTSVLLLWFPFSFFQRCLTDPSITLHYIPYVWLVIIERFIRSTAAIAILIHRIDLTIVTSCASRRVASISPTWRGPPKLGHLPACPPGHGPLPFSPHPTHTHTYTHICSVSGCGTPYRPGKCTPAATADCTLHMHLPSCSSNLHPPLPCACNLQPAPAHGPCPGPCPCPPRLIPNNQGLDSTRPAHCLFVSVCSLVTLDPALFFLYLQLQSIRPRLPKLSNHPPQPQANAPETAAGTSKGTERTIAVHHETMSSPASIYLSRSRKRDHPPWPS